jgi:hypothetical protein
MGCRRWAVGAGWSTAAEAPRLLDRRIGGSLRRLAGFGPVWSGGRTGARREEEVAFAGGELDSRFCVAVGG